MMANQQNPYRSAGSQLIGRKIIYYPRVTSTMDIAREEARRNAPEGTVIIADEQTGGRGRQGRTWLSPAGNISLSVILYPEVSRLPYLVMIASLAVVRCIQTVTGLKVDIKWPNDVLIDGKKAGGILIENEISGGKAARAIMGIGINVNIKESNVEHSALAVTSLEKETGHTINRPDLVKSLLAEIEQLYLQLPDGKDIFTEWREKLVTLGKRVEVTSGAEIFEGTADSVVPNGALLIKLDDGKIITVVAGDVSLRQI